VFARLLLQTGDWDGAAALLDEACELIEQSGAAGPSTIALANRAWLDAQRGRGAQARATFEVLLDGAPLSRWRAQHLSDLAIAEFAAGELTAAEDAWQRLEHDLDSLGIREAPFDRGEPDRIEALIALGHLDRARAVLRRLEWRGKTFPRLWIDVTLPRGQGLIVAAEGDLERSLTILRAADETCMQRLPYELGRHLLLRGTLERRLKQKQASRDSLLAAREIFERLGATPWVERTDAELARTEARRAPTGLTDTERRIAELAASGLTNREIARAAFVSPKTVEANLARVYRKLGIRSRAELGARMAAQP
jgi:DNA-binding CsgD family transcriptional regulator